MAHAKKDAAPEAATTLPPVQSIKGFDANWRCRGYAFEVGKTYVHEGEVKACKGGFHACPVDQHPFNVFQFYSAAGSRFALVTQDGERDGEGVKFASARITLEVELSVSDLVKRAWDYVWSRAKVGEGSAATGTQGAASATGTQGAASATGNYGAASATGNYGAASATGNYGAASATGTQGAASATGTQGAASATGYRGAASATGTQGAASATGTQGAASATGDYGAASATGDYGAASATGTQGAASATGDYGAASATGYRGAASANGEHSAAMATGLDGRVMGERDGVALFAVERSNQHPYAIVSVACGVTGREGIKAGVWYRCVACELVEAA
jgi:hypothetical protein